MAITFLKHCLTNIFMTLFPPRTSPKNRGCLVKEARESCTESRVVVLFCCQPTPSVNLSLQLAVCCHYIAQVDISITHPFAHTMLLKSSLSLLTRCLTSCSNRQPLCRFLSSQSNIQYEVVEPCYSISYPKRIFPVYIQKPDYASHGYPTKHHNKEYVQKIEDITKIWNACKIAKTILMTTGQRLKVLSY